MIAIATPLTSSDHPTLQTLVMIPATLSTPHDTTIKDPPSTAPPPSTQKPARTLLARIKNSIAPRRTLRHSLAASLPAASSRHMASSDLPDWSEAHEIIDRVWVGNVFAATDNAWLKRVGITHIVCAAAEIVPLFPLEFAYLWVRIYDWEADEVMSWVDRVRAFVDRGLELGGSVLIHWYRLPRGRVVTSCP